MANTQLSISGVADWVKRNLGRLRHSKTGLALSALAAAAILYFGVIAPVVLRFHRAGLPDFPDCSGQSAPAVEYLKAAYGRAMDEPTSDEAVGNLGMAFHAHTFYDEAALCYQRAIELNPTEWRWSYYASLIQEELGHSDATIEALKTVLEHRPAYPTAWFRLGNSYLKSRQLEEADSAYREVLRLPEERPPVIGGVSVPTMGGFPLKAYAALQLARVRLQQKRLDSARSLLTGVLDANPAFGPAHRLLGDVYAELGQENAAASCRKRADDLDSYVPPADAMYNTLLLYSRNTDFITRQINIAMRWSNYEWTVALINHILEYDPHDGEALNFKIKVILDTQKIDELPPLVAAYGEQFKSDRIKLLDMAKYLRRWGQYDATVSLLKRMFALNPGDAEAHVEYVRLMKTFWQYPQAIEYCSNILMADSLNVPIRIELVDLLIQTGELDRARKELDAQQRIQPDKETRSMMMARMEKKRGDGGNAVRYYQQALAANPRSSAIQMELGKYLVELRKWNDAARHWQKALQASPNSIEFAGQYALLLAACPDPAVRNGKGALELALRLRPVKKETVEQDITCATALAAAFAEVQRFDDALSVSREYLQLATNYKKSESAEQLQGLIHLFELRKPYRL